MKSIQEALTQLRNPALGPEVRLGRALGLELPPRVLFPFACECVERALWEEQRARRRPHPASWRALRQVGLGRVGQDLPAGPEAEEVSQVRGQLSETARRATNAVRTRRSSAARKAAEAVQTLATGAAEWVVEERLLEWEPGQETGDSTDEADLDFEWMAGSLTGQAGWDSHSETSIGSVLDRQWRKARATALAVARAVVARARDQAFLCEDVFAFVSAEREEWEWMARRLAEVLERAEGSSVPRSEAPDSVE